MNIIEPLKGLALGEDPTVVDWLLALVAGLFIYIALVDVVSLIIKSLPGLLTLKFA